MTREEHIASLCAEHDIKRIIRPGRGRARVNWRVIRHPPLLDEMAYFVALHEIGHVIIGLPGYRLEREALAWQWAYDNALRPPSFVVRQRVCANLVRYIHRAHVNGWKRPPKGHLFWELLRWWELPIDPIEVDHSTSS